MPGKGGQREEASQASLQSPSKAQKRGLGILASAHCDSASVSLAHTWLRVTRSHRFPPHGSAAACPSSRSGCVRPNSSALRVWFACDAASLFPSPEPVG